MSSAACAEDRNDVSHWMRALPRTGALDLFVNYRQGMEAGSTL
jgi:hypothetical protein